MASVYLRTDLANDLRVVHLLTVLQLNDVDLLIGKLWHLWSMAIETTEEGFLAGATLASLDAAMGLPGLAGGLVEVGWLSVVEGGCEIANFDDDNSRARRRREGAAIRQRRLRHGENGKAPEAPAAAPEPLSTKTAAYMSNKNWPAFEQFWKLYPNRKGKFAAWRAFQKLAPTPELLAIIMKAVETQKRWPQWFKDNGQFIPRPSTWLNGGNWEDEPPQQLAQQPTHTFDEEAARQRAAAERKRAKDEEAARTKRTIKRPTPPAPPAPVVEPAPEASIEPELIEESIPGFFEHYLNDDDTYDR
jgi:hypothetical protein